VKLVLGEDNVTLDVTPATDVDFHQELVAVVPETNQCFTMGSVHRRLVTSMDVSSLAERDGTGIVTPEVDARAKGKSKAPVRSARGANVVGKLKVEGGKGKGVEKGKAKRADEVIMVDDSEEEDEKVPQAKGEMKEEAVEEEEEEGRAVTKKASLETPADAMEDEEEEDGSN
jgi:hypothetical protein